MEKLIKYKEKLFNWKFPDSQIENDELAELYSELVAVDAYYAGLLECLVGNKLEEKMDFEYLEKIRDIFKGINFGKLSESDKKIYNDCEKYLKILEELPSILQKWKAS